MKKIVVMGSGNGSNFEAIVKYFQNYDLKILCVSDSSESGILKRAQRLGIENRYLPFEQNDSFFRDNNFELGVLAGYMRILTEQTLACCNFINIHPSLLPAFKGKDAIKRAYDYGVKVSGVSIHHVSSELDGGKIIAQYPVFLDETMNLSEFEQAIHDVEHALYPPVIKCILENKLFSFDMFLRQDNQGCGGCGGCKH